MNPEFQNTATCRHPENMRSSLHGFGQRAADVRQFFCRQCQMHVDIDVEEGKAIRAALSDPHAIAISE